MVLGFKIYSGFVDQYYFFQNEGIRIVKFFKSQLGGKGLCEGLFEFYI